MVSYVDSILDVGVTSWGWRDDDGNAVPRDEATLRVWAVRSAKDPQRFFLTLPVDTDGALVFEAAVVVIRSFEECHGR